MGSNQSEKKLRVLLLPFFASSHIGPFTDLAISLAELAVEATVAVTPANVSIVRSLLQQREDGADSSTPVKVATYPFPAVDGLPAGVENLGKAAQADAWRIDAAAVSEALTRPAQEALIRAESPDALVTDVHFIWNAGIAQELGVPCVTFNVIGAFSTLAMRHLGDGDPDPEEEEEAVAVIPRFPAPVIRIPRTELPEYLRSRDEADRATFARLYAVQAECFGLAVNTALELEEERYCGMYVRHGYAKRAYMLGPMSLLRSSSSRATVPGDDDARYIMDWLDARPSRSVAYVCFGSLAHVSDAQLDELAFGLESSGKAFLWVVRSERWLPPDGWRERVGDRGLLVTAWAPQTAILGHPAVSAFVTHCGWNSVLETVAAGVPVLTWPIVFEQFITERLLTEVLGIGVRLWPEVGAGGMRRSTRYEESETVPAEAVSGAVAAFMEPGGPGDVARGRVAGLAAKVRAAVADGGSSDRDLRRLVSDLMEARGGLRA